MFSYRVPNVGLQARTIGRDKHPRAGAAAGKGAKPGCPGDTRFCSLEPRAGYIWASLINRGEL